MNIIHDMDCFGELIIEEAGKIYLKEEGSRVFLCGTDKGLVNLFATARDTVIDSLKLSEAIPLLVEGVCPLCKKSKLEVVEPGRYNCAGCNESLVNTRGYRLSMLYADELVIRASSGLNEITTSGNVGQALPGKLRLDHSKICPNCLATLNKRGECGKCGWSPSGIDQLWEQILSVIDRVVSVIDTKGYTAEFDSRGNRCKIIITETDGIKFEAAFKDIDNDVIHEIVGSPKAIINWIVDHVGTTPVASQQLSRQQPGIASGDATGYGPADKIYESFNVNNNKTISDKGRM